MLEGTDNSCSISCWMIIVKGPKSACSNVGSVAGDPDTTNLNEYVNDDKGAPISDKKVRTSSRRINT